MINCMKIVVVNPGSFNSGIYTKEGRCETKKGAQLTQPITLGVITAMLRKSKFFVYYKDYMTKPESIQSMKEYFSEGFDLVILNTTTPTFEFDSRTAKIIKESSPETKICGIGTLVSALPEEALKNIYFDFVVRREPEETVLELAKLLSKNCNPSLEDLGKVKGLSFRMNGKIFHNELRPFLENLDELPFPARDIFDKEKYVEPQTGEPYTVIRNSRGCPFQCTFCTVGSYYGNKWRSRSVENILEEIKEVVEKHGIRNIMFLSDTFTANKKVVRELCWEIIENKWDIRWVCNSRVNTLDIETAELMKKAGCWLISFGVESGSDKILGEINKNIKKEEVIEAANICKAVGIKSYMYYILGFLGETKETIRETVDFAIKVNPDYARFFFAVPFPGSELFEECKKNGKLKLGDWSKFSQANCDCFERNHLSYEEVKKEIKKANRKFYLRPGYIMKKFNEMSFSEFINLSKEGLNYFKNWV